MALSRDRIQPVDLPSEEVEVPAIGGAVLLRGLDMPGLLAFVAEQRRLEAAAQAQPEDLRAGWINSQLVPHLLASTALADDGLPVYAAAQWAAFMVRHPDAALDLFERVLGLSGRGSPGPKA